MKKITERIAHLITKKEIQGDLTESEVDELISCVRTLNGWAVKALMLGVVKEAGP